jgi:hypothetical protein
MRCMVRAIDAGWPDTTMGVLDGAMMGPTPGTSTVAFANRVKWSACNWLFELQPASRAVIVTCSCPGVLVEVTIPTLGLG